MQEFITAAIETYRACLCAEHPMPDHAQEIILLNTSWTKAYHITGVSLAQMPQLSKLVGSVFPIAMLLVLMSFRLPAVARNCGASSRAMLAPWLK